MALWSGRFSGGVDQAVAEFSESVSFDKRLYKYDIIGSQAHVAMLAACKIIPAATAEEIKSVLNDIMTRIEKGDFEFKIELEDIHMHIESALIEALGDDGARVHTARSRNDQVALDTRLYLREEVALLIGGVVDFQRALVTLADANDKTVMPGFTHLQHAQPVLFAHHLLAYVEMLDRDRARLADCLTRINVMPLGSGALAGTTLPIDRRITAKILDFPAVTRNSMDAVADRDYACELVSALSIFAMHASRLSEDIILWCSQEFDFIALDDAFCTGSSLMPQKKNPDIAEITRGKAARVYGDLATLFALCKNLPLTYNRDLQEDKEPLFDAVDTVRAILKVFPPMVASMNVNADKMRAAAADPALMATDLAEELVKLGVPFRNAHHQVGAFVKWCDENGKSLDEATLEEMRLSMPEATAVFTGLFEPESAVKKRDIAGGTGYDQVRSQINFWLERLGG